jgi:hypothetical protein
VKSLLATPGMTLDKAAELLATSQLSASRVTRLFEQWSDRKDEALDLREDADRKLAAALAAEDAVCAEALRIGGTRTETECRVNTTAERQADVHQAQESRRRSIERVHRRGRRH